MRESPAFEQAYRKYRSRGVEFVAVQLENSARDARKFLRAHQASYPAGLDPDLAIATRFAVVATPSTLIIDRKGQISARSVGPAGEEWLAEHLDPLLTGGARP